MAYKTAEFEKLVLEKINEFHVPGLSLAVVQGDDIHSKVSRSLPKNYCASLTSLRRMVIRNCPTPERLQTPCSTSQALPSVPLRPPWLFS